MVLDDPTLEIDIRNDNNLPGSKWKCDFIMGPTSPGYKIINNKEPTTIPLALLEKLARNGQASTKAKSTKTKTKTKNETIEIEGPVSDNVAALAEVMMKKILPKLSVALYRDHTEMDLQAKKDLIWEVVGKKLTPQTDKCMICNSTHSVANHCCVYANESELVKTCFSGKSEVMKGTETKRLLEYLNKTVFNINVKDESTTAVQILQEDVWENAQTLNLRREKSTGDVYKRAEKDGKPIPYAYVLWKNRKDFLNDLLFEHPKFSCSDKNLPALENFIKDYKRKEFPWLEIDDDVLGFSNGMLNKRTMVFTPLEECPQDSPQCRTYFDAAYPTSTEYSTPTMDKLLDFQFNVDMKNMLLMSLGRTFFPTNELDEWHYMTYLYGPTGCGKSQVMQLMEYLHGGHKHLATFADGYQKEFGLNALIGQRIFIVEELPEDIKSIFPQGTFQLCIDGASLPSIGKSRDQVSLPFRVPMLFGGNWHFNYLDRGQVARRILTFSYENFVTQDMKDTQIQKKLRLESPSIIRRCLELYHSYVEQHLEKDIWNFAPPECLEAKEEGLSFSNPLFRFLKDRNKVVIDKGHNETLQSIKEAFQRSIDKTAKNKLDRSIIEQAGFRLKKENICRSCRQSVTIEDCCEERSRNNRTTAPEIVLNIRLL